MTFRACLLFWVLGSVALAADSSSFVFAGLRLMPMRWDKKANFAKLDKFARLAAAQGAQFVVTPEGFLEGYVGNEKANKDLTRERYFDVGEPVNGPYYRKAQALAAELNIYLALGFAERRGEEMFNSMAVFGPDGKLVTKYSKMHTADDEPFNAKGSELTVAETPLARFGTLICYDRQLPETARVLAIKGAQMILVPAWGSKGETNEIMMRTRAYENSVWVAFVHPERVMVIDPGGKIVAQDTGSGDEVVTTTIRLDRRIGSGPIRHRRPEVYRDILKP